MRDSRIVLGEILGEVASSRTSSSFPRKRESRGGGASFAETAYQFGTDSIQHAQVDIVIPEEYIANRHT